MIETIERSVIWRGRVAGPTWFHPRACLVPGERGPLALMTCQTISGSDYFGQVHWSISSDCGATWRDPEPIPSLGRHALPGGLEEGVCDVVPEYHERTGTVLAMGHNVYYRDGALTRPNEGRYALYAVRGAGGRWSERRRLQWDDPRGTAIYTCGCAQRVTLEDGRIVVPLSFGPLGRRDRAVGSVLCSYDGQRVEVLASGNELRLCAGRGLLEPSLTWLEGRFYMTIRAEDGRGYLSTSEDGLEWVAPLPWCWDGGEPLEMSTTQQHWLTHSRGLYLVYTRRTEDNANVPRWRAPLYVSRVDRHGLCLDRESERTVLPLVGDGIGDPDGVARMGNFAVTNVSPWESWVTVGEALPESGWKGDTLLARVRWTEPNELAPGQGATDRGPKPWRR